MANSALLSIHRMQCVTTNPHHSLGLLLVRAHKATNTLKLPKWTTDTTCTVPQSCVLEVVGQNYLKLNAKEDLSLGTTGIMQSAHPNSLDTWRPAAVNTSLFTTHAHTYAHKLHISMGFQVKLEQFSSLHNPPTGQRLLELLRASLEALLSSYVWLTMSAYCSTFLIFGVVLHMKEKNSCF